jgi:hypothetical protein
LAKRKVFGEIPGSKKLNTIVDTLNFMGRLCSKTDANASLVWACKAHNFSYLSEAIAAVAGAAIDSVLQEASAKK